MDDGPTPSVEEMKSPEDLTTPASNHLRLDGF